MSEEPDAECLQVLHALRDVIDPEIGLDIVTLGLIYEITVDEGTTDITFTLTTPGCPMEEIIRSGIVQAAGQVEGINAVNANLVWEPRWNPDMVQKGAL